MVKDLGYDNRLRLLRKQLSCLGYVRVPPEVGVQIEDAKLRMGCSERFQKEMGDVDHAQGYVRRMGHRRWLHVHKILSSPRLFGIPKVTLDLKAKAVIIHECCIASLHVTTQ
jgi:hypothetical protein